ncbi:KAP family P-loop NTPase fold protein [Pseudoalteromonas luteoviolacea]|uniref:KAP family P-loop domain protein n=1 Tax=Pseudoalteromonas luteoviolacea (strain 2ta16) TaxID=1353533 RepID=V4I485_PSEL2|nr:KAP family P-loop domain protein [Pseudoalteromonas luteoviolacea]ESP95059.1 KAP family P-loop domain protein [Pseudoalteromonas luteoviolacea 2ta16]KZN34170.1 hypothetical protein N483_25490 [Pseudoalteromonas luteoviolacea NCIMB 1944]
MSSKQDPFVSWKGEYNWEKCKLGNKGYGDFISAYIKGQTQPLVMNLNGSWGIGKTHFLRQLYSQLRFADEFPVIYINAWESDFSKDPILVIINEIICQIGQLHSGEQAAQIEEKIAGQIKKLWNVVALGGATYLSGKFENSTIYEFTKDKAIFNDINTQQVVGKQLSENYIYQKNALTDIKTQLTHFAEHYENKNIIILVDELDRCRPSYAIEFLEIVKHLFGIKGFVFVMATDTEQLSHSVQAVYGPQFNGEEYLSRFFTRSARLPEPNKVEFSRLLVESSDNLDKIDVLSWPLLKKGESINDHLASALACIGIIYGLSLRRMTQLFEKYQSIIICVPEDEKFDSFLLLQLLCEYDHPDFKFSYEKKKTEKVSRVDPKVAEKHNKNVTSSSNDSAVFARSLYKNVPQKANSISSMFGVIFEIYKTRKTTTGPRNEPTKLPMPNETKDPQKYVKYMYKEETNSFDLTDEHWALDKYFDYVELASSITS